MQPYPYLRDGIATVILLTIVGLWARAQVLGNSMGTLWQLVMLVLVIASGYALYGERIMGSAVDDAQELQGQDGGESSTDE